MSSASLMHRVTFRHTQNARWAEASNHIVLDVHKLAPSIRSSRPRKRAVISQRIVSRCRKSRILNAPSAAKAGILVFRSLLKLLAATRIPRFPAHLWINCFSGCFAV